MSSKFLFCTLSAAFLFAVNATAKVVSQDAAQSVARSFMASKGLSDKELVLFQSPNLTALRAQSVDAPAYHIFTDTDKKEFIVVSGDDIARPILGYSLDCEADVNGDFPPAMKGWLDEMERQITLAQKRGVKQSAEVARQWRTSGTGDVVKQLNTAKWNQRYPYNLQCPIQDGTRCYSGCMATAYAILMKYYGYPSKGRGITPAYTCPESGVYVKSRDLNHSYDWDNMPMEYISGQYTNQQADCVAQLMADIGAAVQSDYSNSGTNSYISKSLIFRHFGFDMGIKKQKAFYSTEEWNSMLRDALDSDRPFIYYGKSEKGLGGHFFIVDGYTDQDYFCINWGWGGSYNGAYVLDALYLDFVDYACDQGAYLDSRFTEDLPAVAIVNDSIECPSIEAAAGMVPTDGKPAQLTLVQDCLIDEVIIYNDQNVVIDLNGYTVEIEKYGIFNRGKLTLTDSKGNGKWIFTKGNNGVFSNYNVMSIKGGELINLVNSIDDQYDYRRCIWTSAGSITLISGGKFTSKGQTVCTNGKLTIDGGDFKCSGNSSVISNYAKTDTLTINGGTFMNNSKTYEGGDYRRAVWTDYETATHITEGQFTSDYQVLTFNGNAIIDGATIEGNGAGCLSNGNVVINDCKLKARTPLYVFNNNSLKCYGGIYSQKVGDEFLGKNCKCTSNYDSATYSKYPYKVVNTASGINTVKQETKVNELHYDLNGTIRSDNNPGLRIIRKQDGKSVKILYR